MTTEELNTFEVKLKIRATCGSDARELLEDFTGQETDVEIESVKEKMNEEICEHNTIQVRNPKVIKEDYRNFVDVEYEESCEDCGAELKTKEVLRYNYTGE